MFNRICLYPSAFFITSFKVPFFTDPKGSLPSVVQQGRTLPEGSTPTATSATAGNATVGNESRNGYINDELFV